MESLHCEHPARPTKERFIVSRGVKPPRKIDLLFKACPTFEDFKASPFAFFAPPSPINTATMTRHQT